MGITSYKDLHVYQKAYDLSLAVHKISIGMPKYEQNELASQMRRSSKSICANIAEGYGKSHISKLEFKRYLQIALGSAEEIQVWLDYAHDLGYISREQKDKWHKSYKEIAKMLNGLHQKWS